MAEVLLSPGVLLRENDSSQITTGPVTAGLALVGPTVKGRVNIPTLVTSYSDFKSKFGDAFESASNNYEFLTSIAAYNYFQQGGQSILVNRVTSGSYTPATSSVNNNKPATPGEIAECSFNLSSTSTSENFELKVVYGTDVYRFIALNGTLPQDDVDGKVYFYTYDGTAGKVTLTTNLAAKLDAILGTDLVECVYNAGTNSVDVTAVADGEKYNNIFFTVGSISAYYDANYAIAGYVVELAGQLAVTAGGVDGNPGYAFTLETLSEGVIMNNVGATGSNGSLVLGTKDNVRWQIVAPDSASGTFSVIIRQGNDTDLNPIVLESFTNVSLDPNSDNYIERVIGNYKRSVAYDSSTGKYYLKDEGQYANASRYVRVKEVLTPTYNYFNNDGTPKSSFFTYIPVVGKGAFSGAEGNDLAFGPINLFQNINANTQGLSADDYAIADDLLANAEEFDFSLISTPGLLQTVHSSAISQYVTLAENRGDCFYIMDLCGYGATVGTPTITAAGLNTNYAAAYWPWIQVLSQASGKLVWVPASTVMPGVYTFNDRIAAEWFAPAGLNRGGLGGVVQAERKLSTTDRDTLYQAKVNPIASFPGVGLVAYGQKTLQTKSSALDRVNVRRLMINLKRYVKTVANSLLFEQNTLVTRNNFISQVNPYLETVQQKQGLYAYKVVMDDSNNTSDTIDRNQLIGAIYLQPTKTIEFIQLDFNITPTGVTFN